MKNKAGFGEYTPFTASRHGRMVRKVPLPTYAFDRARYYALDGGAARIAGLDTAAAELLGATEKSCSQLISWKC